MYYQNEQVLETMIKGWTRIEVLLALYDRAIESVKLASQAYAEGDSNLALRSTIEANKYVLGLLSGLDSDQCPIAFGIEQILVFVMVKLEQKELDQAQRFLEELRESFSQIKDEAIELEKQGQIPPLADANVLDTVA